MKFVFVRLLLISRLVSEDVKKYMAVRYIFCHCVSILFFMNRRQVFPEPEPEVSIDTC